MQAGLKTGDEVQAQSLEEPGTRPRLLKGTLNIIRTPATPPYPAFNAYFVGSEEANVATVKKLTPKAELALLETFSNDCHDQQGKFCESAGQDTPQGSPAGKYWLSPEGTFHPVQVTHAEISGSNIAGFAKTNKALRVSGLSPTDVNIEMWHPATEKQIDAIATHLTRWHTYVEAHANQKDTYESLDDAKPHEVAALVGRMNDFLGGKTESAPSRLKEYLQAETDEVPPTLDYVTLTSNSPSLYHKLFEFYNRDHDYRGRFTGPGLDQFQPGTIEGTIRALLDSVAKPAKYEAKGKSVAEVKAFINDLRAKIGATPAPAEQKYLDAINKVLPVWTKQAQKKEDVENAYKNAVENPKVPTQLFNQANANDVKARQVELATNQIISKEYVAQHPEYELEHGNQGSEFGWLNNAKTGEPISQTKMSQLARQWTAVNEAKAETIIKNSDVYVRLEPSSLTGLLQSGKLSTFHEEAGQENSISNHEGGATPEQRRRLEEDYFGKGTYPVYGYLSDDKHGFLDLKNSHPLASVEAGLGFYGDIAVKLKPEVRDRTTYTLGDSAALHGGEPVVAPQPVNHPSSLAGAHFADLSRANTIREAVLQNFGKVSYFESQIHGGVKLSDIADIKFTYKPPPEVQKLLRDSGVKWDSLSKADNEGYSAEEYGITASAALPQTLMEWFNSFANENHDAQGRFTGPGEGQAAATATALPGLTAENYKLLQPGPAFNRMLKADTESQIMQTPNGAAFVQAIDDWASAEKTAALRGQITKELQAPGSGNEKAQAVLGALRNVEPSNQTLYRGIAVALSHKALQEKYKEGTTVDMNLASFSTNHEVANGFSQPTSDTKETRVMFAITGTHKAVPIQNLTSGHSAYKEQEHITGGRFKVTGVSQQQLGGEGPEGKFTVIQLHQVNTL